LLLSALIATSFITGCAVRNPYISPTSGDTAKIRIINDSNGTTFIHATSKCERSSARAIAGFSKFLSTDTSRAGMYGSQGYENNSDVIERIVEADKETNFFVANQGAAGLLQTSCFVEAAFTPKKDKQYEMRFTARLGVCNVQVNNLSEVDGKILKEKIDELHPVKKECDK
jgi:hypothetical protein